MGIYSNNSMISSSGYSDIDIWSPCEQEIRCEGVDINFHEAALMAVAESERVYNNAMKEIGIAELHYLEENGQEMIYEAVDIHGALEKLKKFFVKLIDKVKAIFHAFVTKMSSLFADSKDFANKYKKEFFRKWNDVKSDFEFKGYNFKVSSDTTKTSAISNMEVLHSEFIAKYPDTVKALLDTSGDLKDMVNVLNNTTPDFSALISSADNTTVNTFKSGIEKIKDNDEGIRDAIRAMVASKYATTFSGETITASSLDSSEFNKELFESFRGGESSKDSIEKNKLSSATIISDIENSDKLIKSAKKVTDETVKAIKKNIKKLDSLEKTLGKKTDEKDNDKINYRSEALNFTVTINGLESFLKECIVSANGIYLQALKDKCAQSKAIVAKVIAGGKKMQRESYDYYEDNNYTGSYLDTVVIR